jgi:hypothetical protein
VKLFPYTLEASLGILNYGALCCLKAREEMDNAERRRKRKIYYH